MKTKTIIFMNNSKSDYVKPMEFSFPGCPIQFLETPLTPPEIEKLVKKVNEEYDQIIFFDYCYNYYLMLPIISKKVKVKWILDTSIAALANVDIYNSFFQVIEYKERKLVDTIATLDYSMYLTFKNKYDFMYLTLDIDMKKNKTTTCDEIGIIGYDYADNCSYFNELSAVCLSKNRNVNIQNEMNVTKKFGFDFGLKFNIISSPYELILNSKIILYINFFDTKPYYFLYCMDNEIPCILGNTNLLNNNKILKDLFVVKSDDNIDEISEKIKKLEFVDSTIFKEYFKWRKEYSKQSKIGIENFVNR